MATAVVVSDVVVIIIVVDVAVTADVKQCWVCYTVAVVVRIIVKKTKIQERLLQR